MVVVLVIIVIGVYTWATVATNRILGRTVETHTAEFPDPISTRQLRDRVEPERSRQPGCGAESRGRTGASSGVRTYACTECHGANFGGGVMIDAFPIGRLLGPNLTMGQGSRTRTYGPADWDRIVRHGVLPDGRPAVMPSIDFARMSDQELSDIVAYIRSFPPVDNVVPAPTFGPLGKVLVATGQMKPSAEEIGEHHQSHRATPPPAEASVDFGQHLGAVCTGCHKPDLSGGPIAGGDPSWPPARNLTPHPDALGRWTEEQFVRALRDGVRPDGTALKLPMSLMMNYAKAMTDVELEALWLFVRSVPPVAPAAK